MRLSCRSMSTVFPLTDEQRVAVTTIGRSLIVSAAAGSGKTTVLAERCAYLVCDAPPQERCDVDQLLVLTFTEAAAAEMRSRIVEAIRRRCEADPQNHRLQEQQVLAEAAQISTIHGFCLWVIRRWFDRAGIDPMASVLDADEASLLKKEVLDALFERLYAANSSGGALLGEDLLAMDAHGNDQASNGGQFTGFAELIDVYGLGEDRDIGRFVLKLYEFTTSLPDPDEWLGAAVKGMESNPQWALESLARELHSELNMQISHCQSLATAIESGDPCGHDYAHVVRVYVEALEDWRTLLEESASSAEGLDRVRKQIEEFAFEKASTVRKPSESQKAARKNASGVADEAKDLFKKRIKERFGFFSSEEWIAGLAKVAPAVRTLVELVQAFSADYAVRKRRLNVLDFSDLERLAFKLVGDDGNATSTIAIALRDRYAHLLVDEYQDINPLQQAILETVSRELDPVRPSNLFAVGDVKQSIYRFRLAEPEIFLERLDRLRKGVNGSGNENSDGVALFLQRNFRSRPEILDFVNLVFRRLMTGTSQGLVYDKDAELRAGLPKPAADDHVPVELHLLERHMNGAVSSNYAPEEASEDDSEFDPGPEVPAGSDALDRGTRAGDPPSRWDPIAREAYLIATRIRELMSDSARTQKPIRYADFAILLRSTKTNADRVAGVLASMGIPAHAEVGGSLMGALEVREVVAALQVLDNFQQDIPLAGVLRSGIFGDRFTEDEFVEIRLTDRDAPFHAAVRRYADGGSDPAIRERIKTLLRRIRNGRDEVTRRPLAQTVWNLLERQGYMAYASGLPNGAQRRANLLKLYDLARRFSSSRRQGLHRFLRLMESLANEDQSIAVAPAGGAGDDVVRIMSIHHAKGMEFPVVFVAGLGTKFNLGDRNGRMIFERKSKIGFRAIDTERMVEYPTAVHQLVASEVERSTREEELRVLYVAMTRAKHRLILLGSMNQVDRCDDARQLSASPPTVLRIVTARTPLDWILAVLGSASDGTVSGLGGKMCARPLIQVTFHHAKEMENWTLGSPSDREHELTLEAISRFEPLPAQEPVSKEDETVERTLNRISRLYPWLAASSIRATVAASEFRSIDITAVPYQFDVSTKWAQDSAANGDFPGDAAERGSLTHRALQHMDFNRAYDAFGVAAELDRIVSEELLDTTQRMEVLEDGIAWFAGTPLAQVIRRAATSYRREFRFVTTEPLGAFDSTVIAAEDDRVLVRGIVDGIVVREGECEIVDFKTDAVSASEATARCENYRPQMELYARAVERLWRRPVRCCRIVFLSARCIVDLTCDGWTP